MCFFMDSTRRRNLRVIIMSPSALKMVGGPLHSLGTPTKEYLVFHWFLWPELDTLESGG